MAKPAVLLDFDRTVFDSDRFYDDVKLLLQRRYAIDPQRLANEYLEYCQWQEGVRYYDLFQHVRAYGLDEAAVEAGIERELACHDYVYADVAPFLGFLAPRAELVEIITHGSARFQQLKRRLAPGLQALAFHDILLPKAEFIAANYPGKHGVIIDDKLVEGLPAGFSHIRIDRSAEPGGQGTYPSLQAIADDWDSLIA